MKRNSSKSAENSSKRSGGFTLVELVVVIAVLAILAGVGAVAYRGYINHAKKAGDLELLSAVNTAFSSACTEYDVDRNKLPNGGASVEANKDKNMITGISRVDINAVPDDYGLVDFNNDFNEEFLYVFEPNDKIAMQYYSTDQIRFDNKEHMFVFDEKAEIDSGGIFKDSSFAGKDVGAVSQSMSWGSAFIDSLLKYDNDNEGNGRKALTEALRKAKNGDLNAKASAFIQGLKDSPKGDLTGLSDMFSKVTPEQLAESLRTVGVSENPSYTEMMNGMLLLSAKKACDDNIVDGYKDALQHNLNGNYTSNYADSLPLLLGQLTAYYNTDQGQQDTEFVKKYNKLFQIGEDEKGETYTGGVSAQELYYLWYTGDTFTSCSGWMDYKKSDQAQKDVQAYADALKKFTSEDNNVDLSSPDMFGDFLRTLQ